MSILLFALIPYRTLLFFPPHTSCAENALYTIFIQPSSDSSSIVASFNRHAHICLSKGRLRNQESYRPRCSTALLDPAMKVFSSICTFNYSWDEVSTANWRKYCPWNDKSTHVVGVDTLSRRVDPGHRNCKCYSGSPEATGVSCQISNAVLDSYAQSDLSHAISLYHNGSLHCLEGARPHTSTKYRTLIQFQEK